MHTITKQLEIYIDINIEISEVDHYTWIFNCRIFRLALKITFLPKKYFFLQMAYELLSQGRKFNNRGVLIRAAVLENFLKKNKRGTLIRDSSLFD